MAIGWSTRSRPRCSWSALTFEETAAPAARLGRSDRRRTFAGDAIDSPSAAADLTLLTTAHDVADARIHRHVHALARQGLQVALVGTGRVQDAPAACVRVDVVPSRSKLRRLQAALLAPLRVRGPMLVVDPETVVTAWLGTRVRRVPLIVDLHEDYLAVSRDRSWARGPLGAIARLALRAVYAAARTASLTLVADDHLPPHRAHQRMVVRNVPSRAEIGAAGPPGHEPRALYVGDVRPSRGLWTMLEAIAGAPGWSLDVIGQLSEVTSSQVSARVRELDLTGRVHFHGRLPLADAWAHAEGAWCGLALLEDTPAYREAVPTKLYEYVLAGLPVLTTPLPRVAALVGAGNLGRTAEGAVEAAAILRAWSAHPDQLSTHRRAARAWRDQELAGPSPFDRMAEAVRTLLSTREASR